LAGLQVTNTNSNIRLSKFKRACIFVEVVLARRVAIKMLPLNLEMNLVYI